MLRLFFDVETTGKALMKEGPETAGQPHVVQLAALLVEGEREVACLNTLVIPEGFEVPPEASAIHGIMHEEARTCGIYLDTALRLFTDFAEAAKEFVAHNIAFDKLVMRIEYSRVGRRDPFYGKPEFCTMKAATPICKLPGPYGWKWPKL